MRTLVGHNCNKGYPERNREEEDEISMKWVLVISLNCKALELAFKKADVNGDGKLSVDEYYTVLQRHGIE